MIVDTSVFAAIVAAEPEQTLFKSTLRDSRDNRVSAGSWVEFGTILVRKFRVADPAAVQRDLADWYDLTIVPVDAAQAAAAVAGYGTFGRGTQHCARLNFGDCFGYGLAKVTGEPLLFKGDEFNHTDLLLAEASAFPR